MLTQREYFSIYPFRFTKDTRIQQTVSFKSCVKINTVRMFVLDESPQFTNYDILECTSSGFVDCGNITDSFCVSYSHFEWLRSTTEFKADRRLDSTSAWMWLECARDLGFPFRVWFFLIVSTCLNVNTANLFRTVLFIIASCRLAVRVCAVQELTVSWKIKSACIDFMSWRHLLLFGENERPTEVVGTWELQCPLDLFRVKRGCIVKLTGVCHDSFFVIFFQVCMRIHGISFSAHSPLVTWSDLVWRIGVFLDGFVGLSAASIKMDASISINIICSSGWRSGAAQDNWIRAPFISRISDIRQLITTYPWHYRTFILWSKLCVFMILRIRWFCQYTEINVGQVST